MINILVKCKGCGNKIERDLGYKVSLNGKNNYYCNENEFIELEKEKTARIKVLEITYEIIGNTTNTALFKELSDIAKVHSYTKIQSYLNENRANIKTNMNRISFGNEFGKIRYFAAIIKNSIGDFISIENDNKKDIVSDIEIVETRYKPRNRKKSLNEYMDDYMKGE